jgi:probable HAF family extracellular repeat protein
MSSRTSRAFRWTASHGMQDLSTLGGDSSEGVAMNARGQVTGDAATAGSEIHAFRWTASRGMQDLGTLGGDFSFGGAINARGQVAGYADTAGGRDPRDALDRLPYRRQLGVITTAR